MSVQAPLTASITTEHTENKNDERHFTDLAIKLIGTHLKKKYHGIG